MTVILPLTSHRWPRPLLALVAARAVNRLGAFAMSFLTVTLVTVHGASLGQAGLVAGLFGVMTIPSRLVGGLLADRIGRRTTIVVGLLGCTVSNLVIAGSPGLIGAAVGATLLGLAYEIYEPASQAIVADLVEPDRRPQAYGLLGAAMAVAGVVAGALAAVVGGIDLRLLFVADALSCLVAALVVLTCIRNSGPAPTDESPASEAQARRASRPGPAPSHLSGNVQGDLSRGARTSALKRESAAGGAPWRDRRVWVMLAVGTGFATCWILSTTALPLTVAARGYDPATAGWLLLVAAVVTVAAQRTLRGAAARPFRMIGIGLVVVAGGFAVMAYAASLPFLALASAVIAVGEVLLLGPPLAIVAGFAGADSRAGYLAAYGTCWGVAQTLGPLLATRLMTHSVAAVWLTGGTLALVLAAALPLAARRVFSGAVLDGRVEVRQP